MINEEPITLNSSNSIKINDTERISIKSIVVEKEIINDKKVDSLFGRNLNIKNPIKIGNIYAFYYNKNDYPKITIGPDCIILFIIILVPMCFFVIGVTSFFYFLECFTIFKNNYIFIIIIDTFVYLFFILSYLYTCLINPGTIDKKYFWNNVENKNNINYQICRICNIVFPKSFKAYHCKRCDICIMNHDHHCPWTGKCIGKYNIVGFYSFVISLFCFIFLSFFTLFLYINYIDY